MKLRAVNAERSALPEGGYVQALELQSYQRLLFVSGQIPVTREGSVPEGFAAQARLVWSNLCAQLEAADMNVTNLVKVTTYLSSRSYSDLNGSIRREVLGAHRPALTIIVADIFDSRWLLEIEAIAAS